MHDASLIYTLLYSIRSEIDEGRSENAMQTHYTPSAKWSSVLKFEIVVLANVRRVRAFLYRFAFIPGFHIAKCIHLPCVIRNDPVPSWMVEKLVHCQCQKSI